MIWLQQQILLCLIIFGATKKILLPHDLITTLLPHDLLATTKKNNPTRKVTGETKNNYDSCWNRGFKDHLSSAVACQQTCSFDAACNTWGYNIYRGNKRCHLCTWTKPRVDISNKNQCKDVELCSIWGKRDDSNTPMNLLKSSIDRSEKICEGEVQADDAEEIADDLNLILNSYKDGKLASDNAFLEYLPEASDKMDLILNAENDQCFNDITGPEHACKYASLVLFQMRAFLLYIDQGSARAFPMIRDKQRKKLFDKHKILMADNGWFNTETLESIEAFYSQLPDHLKTEGVLYDAPLFARQSSGDSWKCNGKSPNIGVSTRAFNVFELQVGDIYEQGFPGDTPNLPGEADLQLVVTRHEVSHQFDRILTNRANIDGDSRLRDLKLMLTEASKGSQNNWLRSMVDDAYFQENPQEIIASQIGNQYFASSASQLRLAAQRLTVKDRWIAPSYQVVTEDMATPTRAATCNKKDKNLGEFSTAQQCVDAAIRDSDCDGYEVMYSTQVPSWGCRCCTAFDKVMCPTTERLYSSHALWNVYQYKNPHNTASCENTGIPMSWFLFNVDLLSTPNTNKVPFYDNEVNGYVEVIEVSISRDDDDRIIALDIPSCGEITVTYDSDGIVDSVTSNAITCEYPFDPINDTAQDPLWGDTAQNPIWDDIAQNANWDDTDQNPGWYDTDQDPNGDDTDQEPIDPIWGR